MSETLSNTGPQTFNSISALKTYLTTKPIDTKILDSITGWCDETDTGSALEVTLSYADDTSSIEYDVGEVMAINTSSVSVPASCLVDLVLTVAGDGDHLFTTKYVYMDGSGNVTPYKLDDMKLYCLSSSGTCAGDSVAPTSSISGVYSSGGRITVNPRLANLYEFRLIPLKEKIGVAVVPNEVCGDIFNNYVVRAKVTCKGDTREKQVIIPNVNNMGYPALFDYTIYNSNGTLSPN